MPMMLVRAIATSTYSRAALVQIEITLAPYFTNTAIMLAVTFAVVLFNDFGKLSKKGRDVSTLFRLPLRTDNPFATDFAARRARVSRILDTGSLELTKHFYRDRGPWYSRTPRAFSANRRVSAAYTVRVHARQ